VNAPPYTSPRALELGLFTPGAEQPDQRLPLHPQDVAFMRQAAELQKLSLTGFIVLAAFNSAKGAMALAVRHAERTTQFDLCERARTCLKAVRPAS